METPNTIYQVMEIPAGKEHKKNLQKFADEFVEGYRVMAYMPDVSTETNKKLATLLVLTAILINQKIKDKKYKKYLSTLQFIEMAKKLINCKYSALDTIVVYRAIDKIIEGRHYFNDNTGVKLFLFRADIEGLTTVNTAKYE